MRAAVHLLLSALCLALVSADRFKTYFSKDFRFDTIEFPTELKQSPFNVRVQAPDRSQYEQASNALYGVAVRLKSLLDMSTSGGNFLVSPLSVAAVLGQLLLGARGESRRRISEVLSTVSSDGAAGAIPELEFHQQFKTLLSLLQTFGSGPGRAQDDYELQVASAFFILPDLNLRPEYRHAVTDLYGCDVVPLNFSGDPEAAQLAVNDWAARHTRGHITSVLPYPLPPNTASLVANAVYFRGAWENPFDTDLTITGSFKMGPTERVAVRYMRGQFELNYVESERLRCQMVVLPYKHKQASMLIFLPHDKDYDIRNFTARLSTNDLVELKQKSQQRSVTVIMPRMSLSGSFSLKEPLIRFEKLRQKPPPSSPPARYPVKQSIFRRQRREDSATKDQNNETASSSTTENIKQTDSIKTNITNSNPDHIPLTQNIILNNHKQAIDSNSEIQNIINNIEQNSQSSKSRNVTQNTVVDNSKSESEGPVIPSENKELPSSIVMVPAVPIIIMDVDKTYTLNSNGPIRMKQNNDKPITETFSNRQGEFDALYTHLPANQQYSSINVPHTYPSRPNDKFPKPTMGSVPALVSKPPHANKPYGPEDRISFPSVENTTDKFYPTRITTETNINFPQEPQITSFPDAPQLQHSIASTSSSNKPESIISPNINTATLPSMPVTFHPAMQNNSTLGNQLNQKPPQQNIPEIRPEIHIYQIPGNLLSFKPSAASNNVPTIIVAQQPNTAKPVIPINKPLVQTSTQSTIQHKPASSENTNSQLSTVAGFQQNQPKPSTRPPTTHVSNTLPLEHSSSVNKPATVTEDYSSQLNPLNAGKNPQPAPANQGTDNDIQFDMTGASEDARFRIDDILHQMWIEVTETGTEAAAVTSGTVDYSGDVKLMLVDRPFFFVIVHEPTRATLFWGAISDPTGGLGIRTQEHPPGQPSSSNQQSSIVHEGGR